MQEKSVSRVRSNLRKQLNIVSDKCIRCKLCQKECEFLRKYGKPKDIADSYNPADAVHQGMPFECSLCQLCAAVCPVGINPAEMFLEMRRETAMRGIGDYPEHAVILGYEKRGISKCYTYYAIPDGCDTVFFPGCTLPGTRPDKVLKLYEHMKKSIPSLGIVLDCCTKPSHDLGRQDYFTEMFTELRTFLLDSGVRRVIVACPNCYKIFDQYGDGLSVITAYEFLAENGLPAAAHVEGTVTIHDPCSLRFREPLQKAVRDISAERGLKIIEMAHSGAKTLCCGEGGAVGFLAADLSKKWGAARKDEAGGNRIVTYCAGCANYLNSLTPTSHILDLLFEPQSAMAGRAKVSRAPVTYVNRLRLKKELKRVAKGAVTRERTFTAGGPGGKGGLLKRGLFFAFIITAILLVRLTGSDRYLEQENLRASILAYDAFAPLIYILVYAVAPALFLPGLPLTIAGGILFGPFQGVLYTITGATFGACVAFLISRYIAGDWINAKLKGPRWRRLDHAVERHGWKIVAFTRLIPLFPFNLLNYAFGVTRIKFHHYALATFVFMLPACIAFIVFSSSLLDLMAGKVSPAFFIGLFLIALVSSVPFLYNRYKSKKGKSDII